MKRRKVTIYEYKTMIQDLFKGSEYDNKTIGTGEFHQWGIGYKPCGTGVAIYSTAIIEMSDGSIRNVPVEYIVFND